jgi:hypothetical protein
LIFEPYGLHEILLHDFLVENRGVLRGRDPSDKLRFSSNVLARMEAAMGRLTERVSLITGAARGQGAAEARLFAAEGAIVIVTDVVDEPGEALAATLRSQGASADYCHLDVASPEQWKAAIDHVRRAHGRLGVLVNRIEFHHRFGICH